VLNTQAGGLREGAARPLSYAMTGRGAQLAEHTPQGAGRGRVLSAEVQAPKR